MRIQCAPFQVQAPGAPTADERRVVQEVAEDRKTQAQAAIVRVMKMRRTMPHNDLVAEVGRLLGTKFRAPLPLIKQCIELLIEKEYLERSKTDVGVYHYRA